MKAVITVTGKDTVGIIADVSAVCANRGANIREITQNVLGEYFAMIMIADMSECQKEIAAVAAECAELGKQIGMSIYLQHEDIFNAMHTI